MQREKSKQHALAAIYQVVSATLASPSAGNDVVREAMHSAFLYRAVAAGMDMGIVKAGQLAVPYTRTFPKTSWNMSKTCCGIAVRCNDRMLTFAETVKGPGKKATAENLAWRDAPVTESA